MKSEYKQIIRNCTAVFLTVAAVAVLCFLLINIGKIAGFVSAIIHALTGVWVGIVMAYILNPIIRTGERLLRRLKLNAVLARVIIAVLVLVAIILLLFFGISNMAPQLVRTVNGLIKDLPGMEEAFNNYLSTLGEWNENIYDMIMDVLDAVVQWCNTNLFAAVGTLTQTVIGVVSSLIDVFIGLVVFFYVTLEKEKFIGQAKKILFAVCPNRAADDWILDIFRQTNRIFSGFISGKIIDSAIVGVITFVFLTIFRMPYVLLISVIVGVTNIIPMFGPYIGAIPCAILLLFISPMDCVIFLIFCIVIQQIDGNIIGPKIIGNSTGISAFWVVVSILVFSHLMGFAGMILGVPIFATIYYIIRKIAEESLRKQKLPVDSMEYYTVEKIDENNELIYLKNKKQKKESEKKEERRKRKDE